MKKIVLFLLGIVIGALLMYYYNSGNADMDSEQPITEPKGLIKPNEARVLDQAYNLRHRIINDSLFKKSTNGGDNRSSWWSIEEIQNYINYAENQAGELGYTMDGLRLYLGAHPNANGETGLTTMFFIPTGVKNTSQGGVFITPQKNSHDIEGAKGLNFGQGGDPLSSNYPQ